MGNFRTSLLVLVLIIACSGASSQYVTFRGKQTLDTYTKCLDSSDQIYSIEFYCSSYDVIHISSLKVGSTTDCNDDYQQCTVGSDSLLQKCEGIKGSCTLYSSDLSNDCYSYNVNQVSATFQCVSGSSVYEMCDLKSDGKEVTYNLPAYVTTPYFTENSGKYRSNYHCICSADSSSSFHVIVKPIYEDIESGYDCLNFGISPTSSCSSSSSPPYTSYGYSSKFSWLFTTDSSVQKRGGWFEITSDSNTYSLKVTCNPKSATAAAVTGGVIAGGVVIVVVVLILLVYFTRNLKVTSRSPVQTAPPHVVVPAMAPPNTAAPPYTPMAAPVSTPAAPAATPAAPATTPAGLASDESSGSTPAPTDTTVDNPAYTSGDTDQLINS